MTVVRCTARLLKLVDREPRTDRDELSPSDWYGNLLRLGRRQCLLLVHAETLFAIFEPGITKAGLHPFSRFVLTLIERELAAEALPPDTFGRLAAADFVVGRTLSRSVLGTMTDMRYQIESAVLGAGDLQHVGLPSLNRSLRRIPFGAIRYGRAIDQTRALLGENPGEDADTRPTDRIEAVLEQFLEERRQALPIRRFRDHAAIVDFFKHSLNGYAYRALSRFERRRFDEAFAAGDEDAYVRLFGPEKIPGEVGAFLGDFMIRKVVAPRSVIAAAGPVMVELLDWLVERGFASPTAVADARERAESAGSDLPRAERLARLLSELAVRATLHPNDLPDEDYVEDYLTISRVETDRLWFEGGVGPLEIGEEASRLAEPGWSINIVLGRHGGRWQMLEVGNVYPS